MRFYMIQYHENDFGWRREWFILKKRARERLRDLERMELGETLQGIEEVDVPTHKADLLHFLNNYANSDN